MLVFLLAGLLLAAQHAPQVSQFEAGRKTEALRALIESDEFCQGDDPAVCWKEFQRSGEVWRGDVNGDHSPELILQPGSAWSGTGGNWYFLLQHRGNKWVRLDPRGWQTRKPRFDILPILRNGYHDLRVEVDGCLKWNGEEYVDYASEDYRQLSPAFFDATNPLETDIFWRIRYSGLDKFKFDPQWVPFFPDGARNSSNQELPDPTLDVRWVALFKGGVWGVRAGKGFLLLPQPAYRGSEKLEIQGDWLVIYGERVGDQAPPVVARYNRRTQEMKLATRETPSP